MDNNFRYSGGGQGDRPPIILNQPKKSKAWIWVTVLVAALFIFAIAGIALLAGAISSDGEENRNNNIYTEPGNDFIGVVHIEGTIAVAGETGLFSSSSSVYDHQYTLSTIKGLTESRNNKGLILYIDSPGGEVYAIDEVYRALISYKEKTGRPIFAYCAQYAASGGYYLAAAADHIMANPMCTLGSIGVTYGTHIDISGLLEKYGITATPIVSGDNKGMGDITQPITPEQLEIYRSQIDEYYEVFIDVVAAGRSELTRDQIYKLADGRTYTAKQSLSHNLIDSIGSYSELCDYMKSNYELDDGIAFVDYIPSYTLDYDQLLELLSAELSGSGASAVDPIDLRLLAEVKYSLRGPLAYYGGK